MYIYIYYIYMYVYLPYHVSLYTYHMEVPWSLFLLKAHTHIHNGATSSPLRPPSKQWLLRSSERKEPWECIGLSTLLTSSVSRGHETPRKKNTKRKRVIWQMLSGEWNVQRFVWGLLFWVAIKNVCMFKFPQQKLFFGYCKEFPVLGATTWTNPKQTYGPWWRSPAKQLRLGKNISDGNV